MITEKYQEGLTASILYNKPNLLKNKEKAKQTNTVNYCCCILDKVYSTFTTPTLKRPS